MSDRIIEGELFRSFRIVSPGQNVYFQGIGVIAIETWAVAFGQHYFDYEVNSRPLRADGKVEAVVTTRKALQEEFLERKIVSRQPVPFSISKGSGSVIPQIAMTYGEVSPIVYKSKNFTAKVAWSIHFESHRHVAAMGSVTSARTASKRNPAAPIISEGTRALQNTPSGDNYLMIYGLAEHFSKYVALANGLGTVDVIGIEKTWRSIVLGR